MTLNSLTEANAAIFVQPGGAGPNNAIKTAGLDGQLYGLGDVNFPNSDVTPNFSRDPLNFKRFVVSSRSVAAPGDFVNFELMSKMQRDGSVPAALIQAGCLDDIYVNFGECLDPTDPTFGWDGFVLILMGCQRSGDATMAGIGFDSDDEIENTTPYKATRGACFAGSISLATNASVREVKDVTYGRRAAGDCGNCPSPIPEAQDIYQLVAGDGATNAAALRYSTDGGATWTTQAITGIANTEQPVAIVLSDTFLIVISPTASSATQSGYYFTTVDKDTGVPSAAWTKVTTGTVNNALFTDATVTEAGDVYISTVLGYIQKIARNTAASGVTTMLQGAVGGVTNARIDARGNVIAATTAGGDVYVSTNGQIWAAAATVVGVSGGAIGVVDKQNIWAVDATANVLKNTINGGKTWSTIGTLPIVPTAITDIAIVNQNVIHIAATVAGPQGYIVSTWNGGRTWSTTAGRILNEPVNDRVNRLAVPKRGDETIRANHLAAAALDGAGTGGLVLFGAATIR